MIYCTLDHFETPQISSDSGPGCIAAYLPSVCLHSRFVQSVMWLLYCALYISIYIYSYVGIVNTVNVAINYCKMSFGVSTYTLKLVYKEHPRNSMCTGGLYIQLQ